MAKKRIDMKPIKLEITPDQIMALEKLMNQVDSLYKPTTPQGKAIRSISFEVSDKINSRYRKLLKNTDLFKNKKPVEIAFNYHQAFALFEILNTLLPHINCDVSTKTEFQKTHDFLHQKLI
jgi:predicted site-specific integrase-resolvase